MFQSSLRPALILVSGLIATLAAEDGPATQRRLLNAMESLAFPGIGAYRVDDLAVRIAEGAPAKFGAVAVAVSGKALDKGGKVDAPAFDGDLPGCRKLSMWVWADAASNAAEVGLQIKDGKEEWLMQTVPVDWTGWKLVEIDPTAGGMRQAYEQKEHDGKLDLPVRSVHLIWFASAPGATSLSFDALTASVQPNPTDTGVALSTLGADVIEPGAPLALRVIAENRTAASQAVEVRYRLQANPTYADPVMPDPVHGYDHALGATSTVTVDGVDKGAAFLCDGDEFSNFEAPWSNGYKELVATIDLGQARDISEVRWHAGDANWIFKADASTSLDGQSYAAVDGAQGFGMNGKWGGPHRFPWTKPVKARYLRLRFHDDAKTPNCVRLPPTLMVYDGIANDKVVLPEVGPVVASGTVRADVAAREIAELVLASAEPVGPGGYLLGLETTAGGRSEIRWSHLFVRPADTVPSERALRFGMNGNASDAGVSAEMRRCGFGYMRFENAKWMMFMPTPDHVGFDGSVAPWQVDLDGIFAAYQKLGLKVLPYVFQVPAWATSAGDEVKKNREGWPPRDHADYGEAIFQLVARFGRAKVAPELLKSDDKKSGLGLIDAVELWNEPNLNDPNWGPFVGTMGQYLEVMRAGAEGSRRADPTLPITSGGFAGMDIEVVGQLQEHEYADGKRPLDFIDIINVHFYSGRSEPETCGWDPNVSRNGPSAGGTTYP
ncbi:MAG: discoidin domain-containing protein, partial [Planctomycetes bacterium]|nr:discoidin domain-containing protein [Planctomycetota bacterium]